MVGQLAPPSAKRDGAIKHFRITHARQAAREQMVYLATRNVLEFVPGHMRLAEVEIAAEDQRGRLSPHKRTLAQALELLLGARTARTRVDIDDACSVAQAQELRDASLRP